MSQSGLFRRKPEIEEAPLHGELMLFDPATSRFFVLNRTMAFVWRRCDGSHSLDRMVEDLPAEFTGVEGDGVARDLGSALEELASLGLVVAAA